MTSFLSEKEISERLRALALEITLDDIDRCIKTLRVIRGLLEKGLKK